MSRNGRRVLNYDLPFPSQLKKTGRTVPATWTFRRAVDAWAPTATRPAVPKPSEYIAVLPVGAGLLTSARKYQEKGWGKTTLKHVMLTFQQATPEFFKLVGSKLGWKIR